ncbi:MAG: tape measure protein [Flavobacteriales bacterium]|nr:tape measure protein [Flavobacteriales bacterium]
MAEKKILRSDIADEDVFKLVTESAEKSIAVLEKYNKELNETAGKIKRISDGADISSLDGINKLIAAEKELNRIKSDAIKTDTDKIKIEKELIKLQQEEEKLKQQKIKTEKQETDEKNRNAKATERLNKQIKDEANAYKQLEKNTRDLKNESKKLGAELINLSNAGKKNTDEYRKLEAQYRAVTAAAQKGDSQLKRLDNTVGDNFRKVGSYTEALDKLKFGLGQFGLALGGAQIVNFLAGNEIQLQRMQLALKNVMGTTEAYNKSFEFLTQLSNNYGQDLLVLTDTYKGFIAASESSNLSIEERNKIYQSVIKSGSSLALSNDQIQGSLLAISQMFSKGTVSAEELKGQLGERLPGAFGIMAKSMGVSEQELSKMMQKGQVLAKDVLPKFAEELEKTFGANAQKNLETVGGAWNVLKNKLMLYVNEANNSNSITKNIASGIGFLAKNLDSVVLVLGKAIKWFLVYKTSMVAINTVNKVSELGFKGIGDAILRNIPFTKQYTQAQKQAAIASKEVGEAGKGISAIPWAIIATAVVELAMALWDVASGARQAREDMERLNATADDATKSLDKNISKILDDQKKRNEAIQNQLTAKTIGQAEFLKLQKASNQQTIDELRRNKELVIQRKNAYLSDFLALKAVQKEGQGFDAMQKKAKELAEKYNLDPGKDVLGFEREAEYFNVLSQLQANINGANIKIKGYTDAIIDNKTALEQNKAELKGLGKETDTNTKKAKEYNTEFKRSNEYISEQIKLLRELKEIEQQRLLNQMDKNIDSALRLAVQNTEQNGEIEYDLIEGMISDKYELEKEYAEEKRLFHLSELEKTYQLEKEIRAQKLKDEYYQLIKGAKGNQQAIDKINAVYEVEKQALKDEEILREQDLTKQKEIINAKSKDEIVKIEEEKQKEISSADDELIEAQIRYYDKVNENAKNQSEKEIAEAKKTAEEKKKIAKEIRDTLENYGEQIIDNEINRSKRRAELMQKDLDRIKERESQLREMANQGNLTAKQSLAISEQQSIKKQQLIEKEARKQQALETAKVAYKAVFDFMEKGDSLPIATVKGATGAMTMQALFKSLFGFRKGTKTTVANELGAPLMSGDDGYIARVDGREKILNPELSALTGNATTDEITNGFLQFQKLQNGMIVPISQSKVENKQNDILAKKIDVLTNVIKNKTETTFSEDIILGITRGIVKDEVTPFSRNRTKYRR